MKHLRQPAVHVDSGDALDVRRFAVEQRMSSIFRITLTAVSQSADLDFEAVVGRPARFLLESAHAPARHWTGICQDLQQVAVEEAGLSTYELTIVPALWLLTQRRNHRMFQQRSEIDIVRALLAEWGVEHELRIAGAYRTREYRVQYGESDYAFLCRMLEDAGVSFFFEQGDAGTRLVLADAPQVGGARPSIPFRDNPTTAPDREHVTRLHVGQRVRPGRYTLRDHDPRLPPSFPLLAGADAGASGVEARLERFHYVPGAFSFGTTQGEDMPHGDDRGKTRTDEREASVLAKKRLDAKRSSARTCSFETNVDDLAPGVVLSILDHPRSDLAQRPLLVVASSIEGDSQGAWTHRCEARPADAPYRPPLTTPKPRIAGVESATVVGPPGEEIHTDELGRVRVHFHWDRESRMDHRSSCWIHVSQPWGGAGYGGSNLPRVGQEVLVDFIGGDPDKPIVTGRVYTGLQKTPYKLPDNKTQSGWKSSSSPHTGGYNEIMFEDAAGRELVRVQAEKDLYKLVKNDEDVTIGNNRTKLVQNDDAFTVGNDRTKVVQNDESITIGNDRTKLVQANERHVVGANRSRTVGVNETVSIGADRSVSVGGDHTAQIAGDHGTDVGGDHSTSVGGSQSTKVGATQNVMVAAAQTVTVGGAHALTVGLASAETIGLEKALSVGEAYTINVGATMSTQVGAAQTETVGLTKTITVGQKLEIVCGKAALVMDASGKVVLSTAGGAVIALDDKSVLVKAGDGGVVVVNGGPNVHINP